MPTIGLNPNVNNYTPNYINGGTVITTGELVHAAKSGLPFYLIDVLKAPHTSLPGAYKVPGAGVVDYQNDLAIQKRFIEQLLAITGGSYDAPIVIYCAGVMCWESFNAATRAIVGGFQNVYWYRGELGAWEAATSAPAPPQTYSAQRPGWCSYARKPSETTVCANGVLSRLDVRLATIYQSLLDRLSDADQQQLKRQEQSWLGVRDACGFDAGCLQNAYVRRINELGAQ